MKLTKASEKAMAVVALLAMHHNEKEASLTSSIISEKLSVSDSYTKKILRKLVVADLIKASSGNSGGYTFKKNINKITLLMIIEAIEGKVETFPNHGVLTNVFQDQRELAKSGDRSIKRIIARADQKWAEELSKVTVSDLLKDTLGVN